MSPSTSKSSLDTKAEDDKVSPIFNADDADLILHSLDGVEFKVYRQILAVASTVWADMFSLGAPVHEQSDSPKSSSPPIITLTDKSSVLSDILSIIYPLPKPTIHTLEHCSDLIAIAEKYDVTGAMPLLKNILMSPKFLKECPIRVYAVACSYAWTSEAREASRSTLACDVLQTAVTPELHRMTAMEFLKLIQLHRQRSLAAIVLVSSVLPAACNCGAQPLWFKQWEIKAKEELAVRPNSDVIFSINFVSALLTGISCQHCARSFMSEQSQTQLMSCKERMDALPDTVST